MSGTCRFGFKMNLEKCNLAWHTYSDHLKVTIRDLLTTTDFSDVTLITDDKKEIKAHRFILSACSPVFKRILRRKQDVDLESINLKIHFDDRRYPVINLTGIQHSEMESIMQFMYQGKTTFHKGRMNDFLLAAKNLDVKRLGKSIEVAADDKSDGREEDHQKGLPIETSKIECQHCGKHMSPTSLHRHIKSTHEGVKYNCEQCDFQASRQDHLRRHMMVKHGGLKYVCQKCDKQFCKQKSLKIHVQSVHEDINYSCSHCEFETKTEFYLRKHIRSRHDGMKFSCNICEFQASRKTNLKAHIQSVHENKYYACNQCEFKGRSKMHLSRHFETKHEGIKYACSQCAHEYTRPETLKNHVQAAHEGVKFPCNICDYQASHKSGLKNHNKVKHNK